MARNVRKALSVDKNTGRNERLQKRQSSRKQYKNSQRSGMSSYNRAVEDIRKNYTVLFDKDGIYLHSHLSWFEEGATMVNQQIVSLFDEAIAVFQKDGESLIEITKANSQAFFEAAKANNLGFYDPDTFKEWYAQTNREKIQVAQNLTTQLSKIDTGKKTYEELEKLLKIFEEAYTEISSLKTAYFDTKYVEEMGNRIERYKEILKKNSALKGTDSTEFNATQEEFSGFSVRSLQNNYLAKLTEATITEAFSTAVGNLIPDPTGKAVELVSGNTRKGSSADLRFMTGYFSIKTKKPRQEKSRIMQTFMDWNDTLNSPITVGIGENDQQYYINNMRTFLESENFFDMSRYLIYNYAYLGAEGKGLINDSLTLLGLSSLYEKMFGYNKEGQDQSLSELVKILPIATLDLNGNVIFMDELIPQVVFNILTQLGKKKSISGFMKTTLSSNFTPERARRKNPPQLWTAKQATMNRIKGNGGEITYRELKSMVKGNISSMLNKLQSAVQLTVSYNFGRGTSLGVSK